MCGIIGYVGRQNCARLLIDALKTLEYRGYDSAGVAFFHDGVIETVKAAGRIENLEKKMEGREDVETHCGIGHTRWATHGGPTDENAHPHSSEHISLLHNGIIENYQELKAFLTEQGYTFASQTDTETAVHLMDYYYKQTGDFLDAVIKALGDIRGTYAFGIICKDEPGKIICVRQENPLLIGLGDGENFMASDIPAFIKYTKKYLVMEPGEIAILEADKVTELGKDIAMQIAAMNPAFLDKSDVDQSTLDKEKEILLAQAKEDPKNANKPDAIKEKMVMGRIGKFYKENCLVDQEFVKDPELTIAKYTDKVAKELGGDIKIVKFVRYEKGEGLEKRVDDFASEVAGMVK